MYYYPDHLEEENNKTEEMFPIIKQIVEEIKRIDSIPSIEFDYTIERKHLKYESLKKILNEVIVPKGN